MTGDMLHHALEFAARGWPVFPLTRCDKTPAIPTAHGKDDPLRGVCHGECGRDGHGLYDATTDPDRVKAWWSRWPNANIGGRTGVAFDVLDIDHADLKEGTADWPAVQMPGGPIATTGNGWHFYVAPGTSANRTRFTEHCDWRGEGGYVVLPPSVHPSGRRYEWYAPATLKLHEVPDALRLLLNPPKTTAPRTLRSARPVRAATGRGNGLAGIYGRLAVETEGGSNRNSMLYWAALQIGMKVYHRELAVQEAVEACSNLDRIATQIGLSAREIPGTIESGYRAGRSGSQKQVAR